MDPLFRRRGAIAICRACGAVKEGTASFALAHHRDCRARRLVNTMTLEGVPGVAAVRLALEADKVARADIAKRARAAVRP